jgi:hypothetical protein
MSQENVEIVRRFVVGEIDEGWADADPNMFGTRLRSRRCKGMMRLGRAWLVGNGNGMGTR